MTAAQNAAFVAGAGIIPHSLLVAIASVTLTLGLVWALWLTFGVFAAWQSDRASTFDLVWSVLRACIVLIVLIVLGFYLR